MALVSENHSRMSFLVVVRSGRVTLLPLLPISLQEYCSGMSIDFVGSCLFFLTRLVAPGVTSATTDTAQLSRKGLLVVYKFLLLHCSFGTFLDEVIPAQSLYIWCGSELVDVFVDFWVFN